MGFVGFDPSEKLLLIRKLIEERTRRGLFGRWFVNVDSLDIGTLMGCPEATAVTIVENYYVLCEQGTTGASAIATIQRSRSEAIRGTEWAGENLEAFVRYRVRLEHPTGKQMSDADISRACFIASSLAQRYISEENDSNVSSGERDETVPDFSFICELPEADTNQPLWNGNLDALKLIYYEYPRTIGAAAGLEAPYTCPQVLVVALGESPVLIIRSEQNHSGTRFLCSLDARGKRTNWGTIPPMSRYDFVDRAGEVMKQIK